jgi:hypothetical protein
MTYDSMRFLVDWSGRLWSRSARDGHELAETKRRELSLVHSMSTHGVERATKLS